MWIFIVLFGILGVVSILFPKITRFLYSWDSVWYLEKKLTLKQIRFIGIAYLGVALILWLIKTVFVR